MSRAAFASHHDKVPLGIQLWTVKDEAAKDLEGTLRKVYAAGFREIEFAGYYGKTAAELAKLMKDIGFTLVSTHAGAGDIAKNGRPDHRGRQGARTQVRRLLVARPSPPRRTSCPGKSA